VRPAGLAEAEGDVIREGGAMIVRCWQPWFRALYGGGWPRNYLAVDCETTGFSKEKDVIIEIGHCLVEDGVVTDRLDLVLDWSHHPTVPAAYVESKIAQVQRHMADDGRRWGMSWRRMLDEGIEPEEALRFYHRLLNDWAAAGGLFVTHNGFFDEDMFAYNFAGFGIDEKGFDFPADQYFDTNSIERANQLAGESAALPVQGESLKSYFRRTKYLKGGKIQSSLDKHCAVKYDLAVKYGLDMTQTHSASFDALLCHCLMQEFGKAADAPLGVPGGPAGPVVARLPDLLRRPPAKDEAPLAPPILYRRRKRGQRNR
jgi:DNA polymerase III epsilon subunit-like protein